MIPRDVAKLTNELFFHLKRMECGRIAFKNISILLEPFKSCSVHPPQEVKSQLKGRPRPAMNRKMDTTTDDHGPPASKNYFKQSLVTHHAVHSSPLPFSNTLCLLCFCILSACKTFRTLLSLYLILQPCIKTQAQLPFDRLNSIASEFSFSRQCLLCFWDLWIIRPFICLTPDQ